MFKHSIKQEHLNQYLMNTLQLGAGIGEVHYLVESGGACHLRLLDSKIDKSLIHTTMLAGEDALTTNRNDVLCVFPGAYAEVTETDWDKDNTHIVGLGGRVRVSDYYCDGAMIYTATATVYNLLHVTGNNCQFHNIGLYNNGVATGCVSALKVGATTVGYNNKFYNSHFCGLMNSTQIGAATAASIRIASGASDYYFENCVIGHNCWGARTTATQGQVYFGGTTESGAGAGYGPQNGAWKNCQFLSQGTTTTVPMIRVEAGGNEAMDRTHLFDNCVFENWPGSAATMGYVFDDNCLTWHHVDILNCGAFGYGEWQDNDQGFYRIMSPVPNAAACGIAVQPTS